MKLGFVLCSLSLGAALVATTAELSLASPPVLTPPPGAMALLDAVARAPALSSARARAAAARARLGSAGRFPDPEIEAMLSGVRTLGGDNPMWELNLRQPLPKAGERAADRDRAQAVLSMAEAEYAVVAGELAADIGMAVAEAAAAKARVGLLERQLQRSGQVLAAVDARVATGGGRFGDRLALESGMAALRLMIDKEERMAADALADARGRLALAPDAPLPGYAAPGTNTIATAIAPSVVLASARGSEARAMARMARASSRPVTRVGLRYEREEEPMGSRDTFGLAFMTEIPWRSRRYARAEEAAAYAEEDASRAEAEVVRQRLQTALSRVERAERLAETARTLSAQTHQRLGAEYDALVRNAGTGSTGSELPVLMILEILERQTATEMQVINADADARVARAELWRFAPADLFPVAPQAAGETNTSTRH